jgi:hypothetical protein
MADLKISALTASSTPLAGTEVLPIVQSSTTKQVSVANLTAGRAVSMQSVTANNTGLATPVGNFQSGDQAGARVAVINSGAGGQTYHLVTGNPGVSNSGFALFDSTNSATRLYVGSSTGDLTLNTGNLVVSNGKGIDFSATPGTGTSELLADYEEGTWTPSVGGDATYTAQTGYYTKVGNLVKLRFLMTINVLGTGSTTTITGLPYTPSGNQPVIVGGVACYVNNLATAALSIGVYAQSDATIKFFTRNTSSTGATTQAAAVIGDSFDVYAEVSYQV